VKKERFNHVLRRICQGKCVLTLTKLMLVRKFFDPFFLCPEKIFHPPPLANKFWKKNKIRARDQLIEKIITSKKF
jgi:hypothetical protein